MFCCRLCWRRTLLSSVQTMEVLREEKEQINLVHSSFQINAIFSCIQYCFPGVQSIHFFFSFLVLIICFRGPYNNHSSSTWWHQYFAVLITLPSNRYIWRSRHISHEVWYQIFMQAITRTLNTIKYKNNDLDTFKISVLFK